MPSLRPLGRHNNVRQRGPFLVSELPPTGPASRDNANCRADSIGRRLPINVCQVEPMKLLFCGVHKQAGTSNLALSLCAAP